MPARKVNTFLVFARNEKSSLQLSMWKQKGTHPEEMMTPCFLVCMQYIPLLAVKMDTQPTCTVKM